MQSEHNPSRLDMSDLVVHDIRKEFPMRGQPLVVLQQASFELDAGENLAILGPSGSGKSTLLHILGALDVPTAGTVTLAGRNPFTLPEPELAHFRNRHVGFVFQDHHLLPQLSVLENVLIPAIADGQPDQATLDRAQDLLRRVGLADRLEHRPAELSGGERQRVGVARALIRQPRLLLADEPTGNLDQTNAIAIGKLLLELQAQERAMLVVVTHSLSLAGLLQRRLMLDDGRLKAA
jgi:lipoprotein-releasing system ATP-binding protein